MPCAIACWIRDTAIQTGIKDLQYRTAMINSISVGSSFINTKIPGMQGYRQPKTDLMNKYLEYQQHSWIIKA